MDEGYTLSDQALDNMLRLGWTPDQVRTLIRMYRSLRDQHNELKKQLKERPENGHSF